MKRAKVMTPVTVRAVSKPALVARATAECEQLTAAPGCERVLVVYGAHDAQLYVENSEPAATPPAKR